MRFSQRRGLTERKKKVQIKSADGELRSGLWNAVTLHYWRPHEYPFGMTMVRGSGAEKLLTRIWHDYLRTALDTMPNLVEDAVSELRTRLMNGEWYEIYDFIEFVADAGPETSRSQFVASCNAVLERENSAYRFAGGRIAQVTDAHELEEIDEALAATSDLPGVQEHLETALGLLSDRSSPDYRNSIKESVSAVEALCRLLAGDKKATLAKAVAVLEGRGTIHKALKSAWEKLYGYTSDAHGIRHALSEESDLTHTDAKYMFIACVAFVNYLIGKAGESGVDIGQAP